MSSCLCARSRSCFSSAHVAGAAEKPNIVLLFIDDWAWNGTPVPMNDGMENSRMPVLQMPNVERLAREGMKFTGAYASPQCSPSRVCVQTGQSSARNGFTVFMNDRGQDYYDEKGKPPTGSFLKRNLYFHYPHYRTTMPHSAVVSGSRKLLHFYERPDIPMLFDLKDDTGEVHNIAATHPEEHRRLYNEMMGYFDKVGAGIPKRNPNYDAAIYRNSKEHEKRVQWGTFTGSRPLDADER